MLTSEPAFAVDHRRFGDRAVVSVSGELDIATAPQLAAVLALAMGARPAELWIDFTPTTFIDSTGLNTVCAAHDRFDGALTVICPPHVRRVFEIAGLTQFLALQSDGSKSREDTPQAV
jgi:anti-sigma B factor antagonist